MIQIVEKLINSSVGLFSSKDKTSISVSNNISKKMSIKVFVANSTHVEYVEEICSVMFISAKERGTGIAKREPEYIVEKMIAGKAVIALCGDQFVGFSYIETWGHKKFVANSGLIVAHEYRQTGMAKKIKKKIFELSRKKYPESRIFSITTGLAVMKLNSNLGFRPVPFSELTEDADFWSGCSGCENFDILQRNNYRVCLCTGLLYNPKEHVKPLDIKRQLKKVKAVLKRI